MADTQIDNFPVGSGKLIPVDHTGPSSYTASGETIGTVNNFTGISVAGLSTVDAILGGGSLSDSGNYWVLVQPNGIGNQKTWRLVWFFAPVSSGVTGVSSSGGSGMTAGTYALAFTGGGGSGAAGTVTVSTSAVTDITITNPGSGYTTAPAVAASTGGTPPTLTATVGSTAGNQVPAATDLSGETVRLVYVGR